MTTMIIQPNGRCLLVIEIGTKLKVNNLPVYMADEFIHRVVMGRIYELLGIRKAEIDLGINKRKRSREAFYELVYGFPKKGNWSIVMLAQQIQAMKAQFLSLLPAPDGDSYQKLSQLAFDIILWSEQILNPQGHTDL